MSEDFIATKFTHISFCIVKQRRQINALNYSFFTLGAQGAIYFMPGSITNIEFISASGAIFVTISKTSAEVGR
ncbi:hypothetical protein HKBW3S03_01294 [Candidatus Hakubella thermalkaliphila]|uniref:Uncharacterized protein n=1 Tax=Candidatus Hakubella thermalkaliphila TaxID=2754717 RepID=A0A6V8NKG7_9ACTN|nr:hypothetical protein HKBW3S03_01294 [Candidatus Hakubella thermalkaliphila]